MNKMNANLDLQKLSWFGMVLSSLIAATPAGSEDIREVFHEVIRGGYCEEVVPKISELMCNTELFLFAVDNADKSWLLTIGIIGFIGMGYSSVKLIYLMDRYKKLDTELSIPD